MTFKANFYDVEKY